MKVEMLLQQNLLPLYISAAKCSPKKVFIIWHFQIDTLHTQKSIHYELSCSRRDLAKVDFWQLLYGPFE